MSRTFSPTGIESKKLHIKYIHGPNKFWKRREREPRRETATTMSKPPREGTLLGGRVEAALAYATIIHAEQVRKSTESPYIAHLLGVTSIALEHGANENEAIGALLHD